MHLAARIGRIRVHLSRKPDLSCHLIGGTVELLLCHDDREHIHNDGQRGADGKYQNNHITIIGGHMKYTKNLPETYTGDKLQNQFTAYVQKALRNNRTSYIRKRQAQERDTVLYASEAELPAQVRNRYLSMEPDVPKFQHKGLLYAINQLSETDRTIIRGISIVYNGISSHTARISDTAPGIDLHHARRLQRIPA